MSAILWVTADYSSGNVVMYIMHPPWNDGLDSRMQRRNRNFISGLSPDAACVAAAAVGLIVRPRLYDNSLFRGRDAIVVIFSMPFGFRCCCTSWKHMSMQLWKSDDGGVSGVVVKPSSNGRRLSESVQRQE